MMGMLTSRLPLARELVTEMLLFDWNVFHDLIIVVVNDDISLVFSMFAEKQSGVMFTLFSVNVSYSNPRCHKHSPGFLAMINETGYLRCTIARKCFEPMG